MLNILKYFGVPVLLLLLVVVSLAIISEKKRLSMPTAEYLVQNFENNRAAFEKLKDYRMEDCAKNGDGSNVFGFKMPLLDENILSKMEELGFVDSELGANCNYVGFIAKKESLASALDFSAKNTLARGYIYYTEDYAEGACGYIKDSYEKEKDYPVVENLDTFAPDCPEKNSYTFYQKIGNGWYIYEERYQEN